MTLKASFAIAAVLLILTVAPAGSQTVTPIEFPGAAHTRPHGINSSGEISGIYVNPDNSVHSFLLDRKGFTTIDVPGAIGTNALRINPQGEIVGFYVASSGAGSGFLWRRGTFSDIVLPGKFMVTGNGINARGDVVGQYNDTPGIPQHGYVLNHKGFVAIDVPGAVRSTAFDINERGDIVGAYVGADGMTRLYLLSSGEFTTIDVPGALGTLGTGAAGSLAGINATGDIVGAYRGPDGKTRGFVWDSDGFRTIDFADTMFTRRNSHQPSRGHRGLLSRSCRSGPRLSASALSARSVCGLRRELMSVRTRVLLSVVSCASCPSAPCLRPAVARQRGGQVGNRGACRRYVARRAHQSHDGDLRW